MRDTAKLVFLDYLLADHIYVFIHRIQRSPIMCWCVMLSFSCDLIFAGKGELTAEYKVMLYALKV